MGLKRECCDNCEKCKYSVTMDLVAGSNTITHGLNLSDPQAFVFQALNNSGNLLSISNFSNFTANSFDFNSPAALLGVHITVV